MLSYSFINPGGASGKGLSLPMQETQKTGGSIPGWGRSPGGGHGNPLRYSCLENPMDRGAWRATGHEVSKESDTTERLTLSLSPSLKEEGIGLAFPGPACFPL